MTLYNQITSEKLITSTQAQVPASYISTQINTHESPYLKQYQKTLSQSLSLYHHRQPNIISIHTQSISLIKETPCPSQLLTQHVDNLIENYNTTPHHYILTPIRYHIQKASKQLLPTISTQQKSIYIQKRRLGLVVKLLNYQKTMFQHDTATERVIQISRELLGFYEVVVVQYPSTFWNNCVSSFSKLLDSSITSVCRELLGELLSILKHQYMSLI